ncbi:MAG: acetyl-CoA carboxylase biotin carboxyl carrier protein [Pseudomonadota bacterium]
MANKKVDIELIRELAKLLQETDLSEIEIGDNADRIKLARHVSAAPAAAAPVAAPAPIAAPTAEPAEVPSKPVNLEGAVSSPMVGTAYLASEPGAAPYVRVGDKVSEGDTLLLIEAMKVMNPITAPRSGTVLEVIVENQQPVEFGEPLVVIG